MPHYVGLDVSQKGNVTLDEQGKRLWRGVCATDPGPISARISKHAGADAKAGIETGSMTPWLVHGLRSAGLNVQCLDVRRSEGRTADAAQQERRERRQRG